MALDFYSIYDKKYLKRIYSIDNEDLSLLEPVFHKYSQRTGRRIDIYGTTTLLIDNIKLLISMISEFIEEKKNDFKLVKRLERVLMGLKEIAIDIVAVGD